MIRYTYDYATQTYKVSDSLDADLKTVIDGFILHKQIKNFEAGQTPGRRAAFIKTHGGASATFTVSHAALDASDPKTALVKKGIFARETSYNAWVRFGSDVNFNQNDRHSTVGCSIKLFDVPGLNVLDGGASSDALSQTTTVDFAMQNYQVFFARDAQQMAAYKAASLQGPDALAAFRQQPENAQLNGIINDMIAQDPSSALSEAYWSCVPFILGVPPDGGITQYCKYILAPSPGQKLAPTGDKTQPGFLRQDLISNLKAGAYKFDFFIHLRTSPYQSIENASDNWDSTDASAPEVAPYRTSDTQHLYKIAELDIIQQDISQRGQDDYIESLSFNPWRTLPDNIAYGEIALARRISYEIAAKNRRDLNGQTDGEPRTARPAAFNDAGYEQPEHDVAWSDVSPGAAPPPLPPITGGGAGDIVRVAIHPGIGVARVGNSEAPAGNGWLDDGAGNYADIYIGPETDTPPTAAFSLVRDPTGRIKRQAARFRLFGFNAAGEVVREILPTDPGVSITWKTTLANRKPQWFQFDHAWDTSFFKTEENMPSTLRNPGVSDRASLAITPDTMSITGLKQRSAPMTGQFQGKDVVLGELRTDSDGRLLVLGGMGRADTVAPSGSPDHNVLNGNTGDFNNANNWFDDISDGPVHADVTINGAVFAADGAWVIVAPPNYGPDLIGFRTLHDLLEEQYMENGVIPMPETISFSRHILPSLQRLSALSWANAGFHDVFGPGSPYDFTNSDLITKLRTPPANGADPNQSLRQTILNNFHSPYDDGCDPAAWPLLYGDSFGEDVPGSSAAFLNTSQPEDMSSLSHVRYAWFKKWAAGDFVDDAPPAAYTAIDTCPLAEQPALLDKAALHFCLADAFHPGCEITWPIRHGSIFRAPYRIREDTTGNFYVPQTGQTTDHTHPKPGDTFDYVSGNTPGGALGAQPPGGLTRWMALPWHGDTARCRAGYDANKYDNNHPGGFGAYTPAYWPARVPNQVLAMEQYQQMKNTSLSNAQRLAAFKTRVEWWRNLSDDADSRDPAEEEAQTQFMIAHFDLMGTLLRYPGPSDLAGVPPEIYVEWLPDSIAVGGNFFEQSPLPDGQT